MTPGIDERQENVGLTILFGKPGAGKTTIANHVLSQMPNDCMMLDLDDCIPQWMKDNFTKGIYPTLSQRQEFARHSCSYVKGQISLDTAQRHVLVNFSFVNQDLRDEFRRQFPSASWILLDVSNALAQNRIEARSGHFYKGKSQTKEKTSEWEFDVVTFPHLTLDGSQSIQDNAQIIIQSIHKHNEKGDF